MSQWEDPYPLARDVYKYISEHWNEQKAFLSKLKTPEIRELRETEFEAESL